MHSEGQLQDFQDIINRQIHQIQEKNNEIYMSQHSEQSLKEALKNISAEYKDLQGTYKQNKQELEEMKEQYDELESEFQEQQNAYHILIKNSNEKIYNQRMEIKKLKQEIEDLQGQLEIQQEQLWKCQLIAQTQDSKSLEDLDQNPDPIRTKQNSYNQIMQQLHNQQEILTKKEVIQIILDNLPQIQYTEISDFVLQEETSQHFNTNFFQWQHEVLYLFQNIEGNNQKIHHKCHQLVNKDIFVPEKYRGQIWKFLIGNQAQISDKYCKLVFQNLENNPLISKEYKYTISKDLSRTYSLINQLDQNGSFKEDLKQTLYAMCVYKPDIGYVQGMAYYACMFLIRLPKLEAFQCFANLYFKSEFIQAILSFDREKMDVYFTYFDNALKQKLPLLYHHFEELNVEKMSFMIEWSFTLYARVFKIITVSKIWDHFLTQGDQVFFRVGLAILHILQDQIISMEYEEVMQLLTGTDYKINDDELFKIMDKYKLANDKFNTQIHKQKQMLKEKHVQEQQQQIIQQHQSHKQQQQQQLNNSDTKTNCSSSNNSCTSNQNTNNNINNLESALQDL